MSNPIKGFAIVLLSSLLCSTADASAYTHFWTIDGSPDGLGLVGIYDAPGKYRTQVNYGSDAFFDHFWIPMHIYVVVGLLNVLLIALTLVAFYLYRRNRRRHAPSTAEPGAPPNGGPATPLGNSSVTEGPPSVS